MFLTVWKPNSNGIQMPSSRAFQRRQARVKRTPRCWDQCTCSLLTQRNALCFSPHPHECVYAHATVVPTPEDFCFPPSYNLMGFFLPVQCVTSLIMCNLWFGMPENNWLLWAKVYLPLSVSACDFPRFFWDGIVLCVRRVQETWHFRIVLTLLSWFPRASLYSWFKTRCAPGDPPTCMLRSFDDPIPSRYVLFYRTHCKPMFFCAMSGLWCDVVC